MSSLTAPRKPAPRVARPAARYWKGKAPKGIDTAAQSDSDEDEGAENGAAVQEEGDIGVGGDFVVGAGEDEEEEEELAAPIAGKKKSINVALKDVNISRDGEVIVAGRKESGRTAAEEESEEESEDEEPKPGEEETSEEESSEEESEEEEEKPKVQFRPVFVPKRARVTVAERDAIVQDTEEAAKRKEAEAEERRKQSHDMVAESIRRELAEKEKEEEVPDIDDTDGQNPEEEFEAWRLRELARIKRDKEDEVRREEERAEVERRRALPEEQRMREDLEHAAKSRADKPKGQQKFLQKYWHKGAFHQDEEILKRHDYTEATASTVDVSLLPKVMQVRNFGKRSRTKYTHLVDEDTTKSNGGFGGAGAVKSGGTSTQTGGCFLCGGPHLKKDCPQNQDIAPGLRPSTGANGISSSDSGSRSWGQDRSAQKRESRQDSFDRSAARARSDLEDGEEVDAGPYGKRSRRGEDEHWRSRSTRDEPGYRRRSRSPGNRDRDADDRRGSGRRRSYSPRDRRPRSPPPRKRRDSRSPSPQRRTSYPSRSRSPDEKRRRLG